MADYEAFAQRGAGGDPGPPDLVRSFRRRVRRDGAAGAWRSPRGASNVNVKIPVTNTRGEFSGPLIERLSGAGVQLNVTAVMTLEQVRRVADAWRRDTPAIVSVFAGRIADTGRDPVPLMSEAVSDPEGADRRPS